MKSKIALIAALALIVSTFLGGMTALAGHKGGENHKLVLHINRDDKGSVNMTLNNARNVTSFYGVGNVDIEIVAHGPGLNVFKKDTKVADKLRGLHALGNIKFAMCANTMKVFKIAKADLLQDSFIQDSIVPAGVVRIMELQEAGWKYIKP